SSVAGPSDDVAAKEPSASDCRWNGQHEGDNVVARRGKRRAPLNRMPATGRRAKHGEEVMRMVQWTRAGVCAALLLSGGVSFAEGSSPPQSQTENADATRDRGFLASALRVNQVELTLG